MNTMKNVEFMHYEPGLEVLLIDHFIAIMARPCRKLYNARFGLMEEEGETFWELAEVGLP